MADPPVPAFLPPFRVQTRGAQDVSFRHCMSTFAHCFVCLSFRVGRPDPESVFLACNFRVIPVFFPLFFPFPFPGLAYSGLSLDRHRPSTARRLFTLVFPLALVCLLVGRVALV